MWRHGCLCMTRLTGPLLHRENHWCVFFYIWKSCGVLRVYEGQSEAFSTEAGQEVLYENTGYSRYFASSFPVDISGYKSWRDFETADFDEVEQNRGAMRINRVARSPR